MIEEKFCNVLVVIKNKHFTENKKVENVPMMRANIGEPEQVR